MKYVYLALATSNPSGNYNDERCFSSPEKMKELMDIWDLRPLYDYNIIKTEVAIRILKKGGEIQGDEKGHHEATGVRFLRREVK